MKRHLNLLPWNLRCRMLLRQRLRQWTIAWSVLAVGCGLFYAQSWHGLSTTQEELELWQRRAVAVQAVHKKNETLRRKIAALRERLTKYGHLNSEQIGFQLLATISQSSESVSGKIQVQNLAFRQTQVAEAPAESKAPVPPVAPGAVVKPPKMRDVRTLSLTGIAANNLAVAQFVSSLRDCGAFQNVDLKSSKGSKVAGSGVRNYLVECTF